MTPLSHIYRAAIRRAKERIPGGLAKGKKPSDFDPDALAKGVKVEMEHTTDEGIAREIAMDHLTEDPAYYDKLEQMEKKARRVAARWVARQAGMFEPPPAMVKAIRDWVFATYAGRVLTLTEERIEFVSEGPVKIRKVIKWLDDLDAQVEAKTEALNPGQSWQEALPPVKVSGDSHLFWAVGIHRAAVDDPIWLSQLSETDRQAGQVYVPSVSYANKRVNFESSRNNLMYATKSDAVQKIKTEITRKKGRLGELLADFLKGDYYLARPETVTALHNLRRECLKYTSVAKKYPDKVTKTFLLDVSGWKYLTQDIKDFVANRPEWQKIYVTMFFRSSDRKGYGGWWKNQFKELIVYTSLGKSAYTVEALDTVLNEAANTIYHEVQHLGQYLLGEAKKLKTPAGLPSPAIRQPGVSVWGIPSTTQRRRPKQIEHPLRDIEFYTDLGNAVTEFENRAQYISRPDLREFLRFFVGLPAPGIVEKYKALRVTAPFQRPNSLIDAMRKGNPAKWQKAVKELIKSLEAKGYPVAGVA